MSKSLTDHHDDGQRDAAKGNGYNPPHSLLENFFTWSSDGCKAITENNGAYGHGFTHANDQKR